MDTKSNNPVYSVISEYGCEPNMGTMLGNWTPLEQAEAEFEKRVTEMNSRPVAPKLLAGIMEMRETAPPLVFGLLARKAHGIAAPDRVKLLDCFEHVVKCEERHQTFASDSHLAQIAANSST